MTTQFTLHTTTEYGKFYVSNFGIRILEMESLMLHTPVLKCQKHISMAKPQKYKNNRKKETA